MRKVERFFTASRCVYGTVSKNARTADKGSEGMNKRMTLLKSNGIPVGKKIAQKVVANVCRYVFLLAFSYVLIYPIIYMIVNSIMTSADYYNPSVQWVPIHLTWENFQNAWTSMELIPTLISTLVNELVAAGLGIASCAVAAFGLARFNFKGKSVLSALMILSILVPNAMTIIPSYVNFHNLHLLDTPFVFWIPSVLGVGLSGGLFIYIYSQFFKGLPKEIEEAAWVDGAGTWRTFLQIVLPSSSVVFVTVTVFSVIWHWNDSFLAQMYLTENYPIGTMMSNYGQKLGFWLTQTMQMSNFTAAQITIAACLIALLPILVFYIIIQKRFIASVATSGIVG